MAKNTVLVVIALFLAGLGMGFAIGKAYQEQKEHEAWLAQPAYEWYDVLGTWDVYTVFVDNETVLIVWYNETEWGGAAFERNDPYFSSEIGSGETPNDWFVLQAREYYIHYNNGSDMKKDGVYWVLVI